MSVCVPLSHSLFLPGIDIVHLCRSLLASSFFWGGGGGVSW